MEYAELRTGRILYLSQQYASHARVAADYKEVLQGRYTLASSVNDADIVILHMEPHDYQSLYQSMPALRSKYVISYCVWEASALPFAYKRSLSLVQEVWTCSDYCATVLREAHPYVFVIPHMIERDISFSAADARAVKRAISYEESAVYFLSVGRTLGTRKNLRGLMVAFTKATWDRPGARLIVKLPPNDPPIQAKDPKIIDVPFFFSEAQMNALFSCAQAVISAHHAEGWGLSLSDAFIFGIPAIATRYSGNLHFMTDQNSYLIDSCEHAIPAHDTFGLFTSDMRWATPREEALVDTITKVYKSWAGPEAREKVAVAKHTAGKFSKRLIAELLYSRLDAIIDSVS